MVDIIGNMQFPHPMGVKCDMMPFIQGDSKSLPERYQSYASVVDKFFLDKGEIGFLTIHESYVEQGRSQRGYNSSGINRNVHVEVGQREGLYVWGGYWGRAEDSRVFIHEDTEVLIANSISDTCCVWDTEDMSYTEDGDLGAYIDQYPEDSGYLMKEGEVARISIFTPHECVAQPYPGIRQFFRIVGSTVEGREEHFTVNPLME